MGKQTYGKILVDMLLVSTIAELYCGGQYYWYLTLLSTIAQLYCGGQFYWCLTLLTRKAQLYYSSQFGSLQKMKLPQVQSDIDFEAMSLLLFVVIRRGLVNSLCLLLSY
jgi:hypothetical protein